MAAAFERFAEEARLARKACVAASDAAVLGGVLTTRGYKVVLAMRQRKRSSLKEPAEGEGSRGLSLLSSCETWLLVI